MPNSFSSQLEKTNQIKRYQRWTVHEKKFQLFLHTTMNKHKESFSNGKIGKFKDFKIKLHMDNTGYTTREMHSFLTEREKAQ